MPGDHPDRNAAAAQASNDSQSTVAGAKNDGARGRSQGISAWLRHPGQRQSGYIYWSCRIPFQLLTIQRVSAGAVKLVPATNLINGPKLSAAGAPRKWSPGKDVSKPELSSGDPISCLIFARISGARNE